MTHRIATPWLTCALSLFAAAACSPQDGSTSRPQDKSTASGLVLEGLTSIPSADVRLTAGGQELTTRADSTGRFSLPLDFGGAVVLVLRARGADARGGQSAELASILGDLAHLAARAGGDGRVSVDALGATRVTPLSTALYAAVYAAAGREPATTEDLVAAEQRMFMPIETDELLDLAAALDLLIGSPAHSLPTGYPTTLALAQDLPALRRFARDLRAQAKPADPLGDAAARLLATTGMVAAFPARPAKFYATLVAHRNGFVGGMGGAMQLDAGGRGSIHDWTSRTILPVGSIGWSVASGVLRVTCNAPLQMWAARYSASEIAELYPNDTVLADRVRTALGSNRVVLKRYVESARVRLLGEGVSVVWVEWQETGFQGVSEALAPYGIAAPDVDWTDTFPTHLAYAAHLSFDPLTSGQMLGTWVLPVMTAADRASVVGSFAPGDPVQSWAIVTFRADNTATVLSPMLAVKQTLAWQILSDGRLDLTYPNGARQRLGRLTVQGEEHGILSEFVLPDGTRTTYDPAIKVGPPPGLGAGELVLSPGEFLRSTINWSNNTKNVDGEFPVEEFFGFVFETGGGAYRVLIDYTDPTAQTGPFLFEDLNFDWRFDGGAVVISRRVDSTRQFDGCQAADPSCVPYRWRVWQPLARAGNLLYVLEYEMWLADDVRIPMRWNAVSQAWEIGGVPADLSRTEYFILPRLNAYARESLPVF